MIRHTGGMAQHPKGKPGFGKHMDKAFVAGIQGGNKGHVGKQGNCYFV
jgi:hypothetical protein